MLRGTSTFPYQNARVQFLDSDFSFLLTHHAYAGRQLLKQLDPWHTWENWTASGASPAPFFARIWGRESAYEDRGVCSMHVRVHIRLCLWDKISEESGEGHSKSHCKLEVLKSIHFHLQITGGYTKSWAKKPGQKVKGLGSSSEVSSELYLTQSFRFC